LQTMLPSTSQKVNDADLSLVKVVDGIWNVSITFADQQWQEEETVLWQVPSPQFAIARVGGGVIKIFADHNQDCWRKNHARVVSFVEIVTVKMVCVWKKDQCNVTAMLIVLLHSERHVTFRQDKHVDFARRTVRYFHYVFGSVFETNVRIFQLHPVLLIVLIAKKKS